MITRNEEHCGRMVTTTPLTPFTFCQQQKLAQQLIHRIPSRLPQDGSCLFNSKQNHERKGRTQSQKTKQRTNEPPGVILFHIGRNKVTFGFSPVSFCQEFKRKWMHINRNDQKFMYDDFKVPWNFPALEFLNCAHQCIHRDPCGFPCLCGSSLADQFAVRRPHDSPRTWRNVLCLNLAPFGSVFVPRNLATSAARPSNNHRDVVPSMESASSKGSANSSCAPPGWRTEVAVHRVSRTKTRRRERSTSSTLLQLQGGGPKETTT